MVEAIRKCKDFKSGNTRVVVSEETNTAYVYLHDVFIASVSSALVGITNCGRWRSYTTKSRLNAILQSFTDTYIYQRNWEWYFADGTEFGNGAAFTRTK